MWKTNKTNTLASKHCYLPKKNKHRYLKTHQKFLIFHIVPIINHIPTTIINLCSQQKPPPLIIKSTLKKTKKDLKTQIKPSNIKKQ